MKKSFEAMKKSGMLLAFFALVSVVFVVSTNSLTKNAIAENDKRLLLRTINEIIPPERYDNDLVNAKIVLKAADSGFEKDAIVYLATLNGKPSNAIFNITTLRGYGVINLLIGINTKDQTLAGVRVVWHSETPGLGDKIEIKKDDWVLSFNGKSLSNPDLHGWAVKKDGGIFDQFTGATITPRAIVNTVKSTLLYAQNNLDTLFKEGLKTLAEGQENDG